MSTELTNQQRGSPEIQRLDTVFENKQQQQIYEKYPQEYKDIFKKAILVLGVSVVGIIVFKVIDRYIKRKIAFKELSKTFGTKKYPTWAKLIKMGFDNNGLWGTDVPLIRQTIKAIPTQEDFKHVAESYKKQTKGRILYDDLARELTNTEYTEMLAIKRAKPKDSKTKPDKYAKFKGWAQRFNSAVNYTILNFMPATDEDAIYSVFGEMKTKREFNNTAYFYRKMFGLSLWEELDGDMDNWREYYRKLH